MGYKIVIWQHWPQDLPIKQYNISPVSPPSILVNQTISQQSTPQSHSDNNGHSASLQVSNTGRHMSSIYKLYPPQRLTKQPPLACERGLKSSQRDVVVISLSLSIQTRTTTTSSQTVVIVTNKNKNNNNNKRFQTILGRGLEYTLSWT